VDRQIEAAMDRFNALMGAARVAARIGDRTSQVINLSFALENLDWQERAECAAGHDGADHTRMVLDLETLRLGIRREMGVALAD